ncbi:glycine betaine ABC transporter substrate-binding protein [Roseococcus pinisoli]|uniref:ABC-type glycine betaine transport system substrate-binding domain-containing protein n=1 Tax=Roseococcus pinisoli TaxID=2835040 RepID=A0ABS5QJP9_9PROT|nr:glycine betaine ABC transporter substrate-binding protein [Roseococcus pinisoli]MBS7813641.1 hypothetical protein [Roseococcus pinisoli]
MSLRSWRRYLQVFKAASCSAAARRGTNSDKARYGSTSAFVYAFRTNVGRSPQADIRSIGSSFRSGWLNIGPLLTNTCAVVSAIRAGYTARFDLDWIVPSGIDNGNALLVTAATAQRLNLATLSDLAREAPRLPPPAAGSEFADRADVSPRRCSSARCRR